MTSPLIYLLTAFCIFLIPGIWSYQVISVAYFLSGPAPYLMPVTKDRHRWIDVPPG